MRQRQRPTLGRADGSRPWRWERIFSRSCCMRRADHASTTTVAASCCSSARRTWATGKACRRVFAGDDFLTVASADDMARVTTWRQQRHGIHSARAARRTLRAVPSPPWPPMPPRKARRGHDAVAGCMLAGGLQSGARAAHPVPSRACPAQACPGSSSPSADHRAAPAAAGREPAADVGTEQRHGDGCCSSQLAVPDRFKETGQRAFALVRRPTTAIVAAVSRGSIRPARARATAPPSR